jgi:hypothetical protein
MYTYAEVMTALHRECGNVLTRYCVNPYLTRLFEVNYFLLAVKADKYDCFSIRIECGVTTCF